LLGSGTDAESSDFSAVAQAVFKGRIRRSAPPFAETGRIRLVDLPIEKLVIAGPGMDLAPANLATEAAGMLVLVMFPRRGVRQPAMGAAKIFGCPNAICHPTIMRSIGRIFQRSSVP
jgi:hypothetical protein